MAVKMHVSLLTAPIELIYLILDKFDLLTIHTSFRNVCQRFNRIIDSYPRYQVLSSWYRLRIAKQKSV